MILFTYVFSFGFARVQSNRDFFSVISMMVRQDAFMYTHIGENKGVTTSSERKAAPEII